LDRTLGTTLNDATNLTVGSLVDVGVAFAPTEIDGDKLVLVYPGVPSRCPRCPKVYRSTGYHAMQSMFRHLEESHGLRGLKRWWKCSACEFKADGHKLNAHFKKNHSEVRQQPLEVTQEHETTSEDQTSNQSSTSSTSSAVSSSSQQATSQGTPVPQTFQQTPPQNINLNLENPPMSENSRNESESNASVFTLPNHEEGWLYTLPRQSAPSQESSSTPPPSLNPDSTQLGGLQIENQRFEEAGNSFFSTLGPLFYCL
jgi:hypothetical protein